MATTHKVDIFKVLADINANKRDFYTDMAPEEQKAIHPLVLMRWMSGVSSPLQIMLLNEFANKYMFDLSTHKELLMDLLVTCSPGIPVRYKWKKAKTKKSSTPKIINMIKDSCDCSSAKAIDYLPLLSRDDIMEMVIDLGYQSQDIKDIKKELKLLPDG